MPLKKANKQGYAPNMKLDIVSPTFNQEKRFVFFWKWCQNNGFLNQWCDSEFVFTPAMMEYLVKMHPEHSTRIMPSGVSRPDATYTWLVGKTFSCAEQWMMAYKAAMLSDHQAFAEIMGSKSPRVHKARGRKAGSRTANPNIWNEGGGDEWDSICDLVVLYGNMMKFAQNEDLKAAILSTGDAILTEASPYDKIWGIGQAYVPGSQKIFDQTKWKGKNKLRHILMKVRETLKLEEMQRIFGTV